MWSLLVLCLVVGPTCFATESIYEALQTKPEFRKFYELAKNDSLLRTQLEKRTVTVFVPTARAIETAEEWVWDYRNVIASYHVVVMLATKNVFPYSQQSYASGAAPLRLAIHETEKGEKEYFVNNAKILSEAVYYAEDGNEQLLYVIDKLIEPYVPKNNVPPTALSFLNQPGVYNIAEKLGGFASRVRSENEDELFQRVGQHTYFFPQGAVDGQNFARFQEMDKWVIRGHVIPNHVLFTRTMGDMSYRTEAHNRNLKVEISLWNRTDDENGYVLYAQSNTLQNYQRHRKGVVLAKIVRPNIPVANGVVHVIENPLMIIGNTIWQFLQEEKGRFSEFMKLLKEDGEFVSQLQSSFPQKTLFLPNNRAMRGIQPEKLKAIKENSTALNMFLNLHLALTSVSTEDVTSNRVPNASTADNQRKLYFQTVGGRNKSMVLTVEGGGVNATVVEADIGATNGIIHVINRVLGMPFMTIYGKLKEDPELYRTFQVSHLDDWNWQLRDQSTEFTFFAPSEEAWSYMSVEMPTVYKQMTMKEFPYHVHKIFDRHLKIGEGWSSEELIKYQNVQMIHGLFKVERKGGELFIEWEGERSRITRPDVKATNGVIHVIDRVMMKKRDLKKGSANSIIFSELLIGICVMCSYILF